VGRDHSARWRHWLTGGPERHTVERREFKPDSKLFQTDSKFSKLSLIQKCIPVLKKSEIKYGWKEHEMRNNFA
jgi:hypothetical protein